MEYESRLNHGADPSRIFVGIREHTDFSPQSASWFPMASYWLDIDQTHFYSTHSPLADRFFRKINNRSQILFLVHPDSESFYSESFLGDGLNAPEKGLDFYSLPTASTRTVLTSADNYHDKFFAKVSLNKQIGGFKRTITGREAARSIGTTLILQSLNLPENFHYFPEVLSVIPKDMERGAFIIREIPSELLNNNIHLMPLFSLYTPQESGSEVTPIQKMIQKTEMDPLGFVNKYILTPFAKLWLNLVIEHGIAIEAHGQNVLLALDKNGIPDMNFYFRDHGGFNIDLAYLKRKNINIPDLPTFTTVDKDYFQKEHLRAIKSSLFNYFEGSFLHGLSKHLSDPYGITYETLQHVLKNALKVEARHYGINLNKLNNYGTLISHILYARNKFSVGSNRLKEFYYRTINLFCR